MRGMTDGQLAMLRANEDVAAVEVHATSLEDIFIAYMQGNGDGPSGQDTAQSRGQNVLQEAMRP